MQTPESDVSKINSLFIFGYFGWYNSGDDAIGYSVLKEIFSNHPHVKFCFTAKNPYFAQYSQHFCPNARLKFIDFHFLAILQSIIQSDAFIITGGTHFHDEDHFLLRRFLLFVKFYGLVLFARIMGKKPIMLGHGVGPVSKWWSTFLLKRILANTQIIFVRDTDSKNVIDRLGFPQKCVLGFDCSAILFKGYTSTKNQEKKVIGISLLPAYSIYSAIPDRDNDLIYQISQTLKSVLQKEPDLYIHLFAFRTGLVHSDIIILNDLKKLIEPFTDRIEIIEYNGDVCKFIGKIDTCDYFIGMRFHSSLFAYLLEKPQIVIDYMGKCRSLAKEIELFPDALIPLDSLDGDDLFMKTTSLIESPEHYIARKTSDTAIIRAKDMFRSVNGLFLREELGFEKDGDS